MDFLDLANLWLLTCFICRIFPRASGKCREVTKWYVCTDLWHAVHAEFGSVPGPLHRAKKILHWGQCESGGDAQWLLGSAPGTNVSADQPTVSLQRGLPGVREQIHRPAEAIRRCSPEAENSGHSRLHCCSDICPGADRGQRSCKSSFQGNWKSTVFLIGLSHFLFVCLFLKPTFKKEMQGKSSHLQWFLILEKSVKC